MNAAKDGGVSNLEGQRQAKLSPAFPAMEGSACAAGNIFGVGMAVAGLGMPWQGEGFYDHV